MPAWLADRVDSTGEYQETNASAPGEGEAARRVVPAQWPETYSYTLTAAIDAGLPIVAPRIGAFVERLEGRPLTWLVDPTPRPRNGSPRSTRCAVNCCDSASYRSASCANQSPTSIAINNPSSPSPHVSGPIDLRRKDRISVVVIPERFPSGPLTPCAYIRLLQPLDDPDIGGAWNIVIADAVEALHYRADIIVTHRYAVADIEHAEALISHCREHGIALLYDIDDDLLKASRATIRTRRNCGRARNS